jgi:tetratricopeptide (TPR) repeat protein
MQFKVKIMVLLLTGALFAAQSGDDLLVRATDLYKQGRYGQAILLYRKAEQRGADPFVTSFNIGNCLFQEEKFPESAAAYRKAVDYSNGEYAPALFNLASVLFRLGEYPESVAAYRRALAINPENISAWLFLGEAYARTGDKVGTLRALEKAYESAPEDISIVYQLSEAYIALGDFANAVALVRKAYIQNPRETDFLIYVGDIYRLQKNYDECIGAYREALSISPDNTALLYKLADVLSESGNNYVAMDVLSQILQIDPRFSDAAIFLGNLAFDAKWWDRAELAYTQAAKNHNEEALYGFRNLAYEAFQRGDHESSKRYLVTARKYYPQDESLQAELLNLED